MFTVLRSDAAFEETGWYVRANPERKADFAAALRHITGRLSADPLREGESREEEMRVMFADPLTVFFSVDEAEGVVHIGHVRLRR